MLKKIIMLNIFLLFSVFVINVDANSIKEDSSEYTTNVYIMGGTKFTKTVTAKRAFNAGMNYKDLKIDFPEIFGENSDKTYMYSKTFKKWYEVPEAGGDLIDVSAEEKDILENDLYVFYVNNEVKMLKYTTSREVDENGYDSEMGISYNSETGTFTFPATLTEFSYMSNGNHFVVDTVYDINDDEYEYGSFFEPYIITAYDYDSKNHTGTFFTDKDGYIYDAFEPVYICEMNEYDYDCVSKIVKNYVDEDGNDLGDISKIKFTEDTDVYQVLGGAPVIEVGGLYYEEEDIVTAIEKSYYDEENPENSIPAYLYGDLEVEKLITLASSNKNMYLDLNWSTLSRESGGSVIYLTGENSKLYIDNGYIENETGNAITAGVLNTKTNQKISLNIGENVEIATSEYGVVTFGAGVNLDFAGKLFLIKDGAVGISGNGYDKVDSKINILANSVIRNYSNYGFEVYENTVGIYLPQKAIVNINEASIETSTPIVMKSGTLNISGGYYHASGIKNPAAVSNNGAISTGDAIYVELNSNYADNVKINVDANANLQTTNGYLIQVYNPENMKLPEISVDNSYINKFVDENNLYYSYDSHAFDAVIKVGNIFYGKNDIKKAIENSSDENPAYLLDDLVLSSLLTLDKENTDMYLDLQGFSLTRDAGGYVIYQIGKGSKLHIDNGIIRNTTGQAITAGSFDNTGENQDIYLEIGTNLHIYTSEYGIVAYGNGVTLDFAGIINLESSDAVGISGNGTDRESGVINIKNNAQINSTLVSDIENNTFAFYLPQKGIVNIEGGMFTAGTVIGMKAGTLNITGGEFTAIGDKNAPGLNNNGIDSTGDVIYVEMNKNYADNIIINISDALLYSYNGANILVYNPDNMDEPTINVDYNILRNGDITYYGFDLENAMIQVGNDFYTNLSYDEAFANSSNENPAYILKSMIIEEDFTLEQGDYVIIQEGATLEVLGNLIIEDGANLIVCGTLKYGANTTIDGKVTMAGGNIFDEVNIVGNDNAGYISTDAVFDLDANGDITIISGSVQLGMSFNTMAGQKLLLKSGSTFIIPEELTLYVYSNLTVEDGATLQVDGTLDLTNAENFSGATTGEGLVIPKKNN